MLLKLMRLKSGIWVAAYLRRCNVEGVFAAVRRRGAEEAGAIFIKINRLDGTGILYGPAPQAVFGDARPADRVFSIVAGRGAPAADSETEPRAASQPRTASLRVSEPARRQFMAYGAVAAGAALGFVSAAAAASWAGAAPGPNLCWYYTDPSYRNGFWDAC